MGDVLLPVERTMNKAGWGLVPGLQAPLLHIHTTAAPPWAAPTTAELSWAGLGWAGGLRRSSPAQIGSARGEPLVSDQPQSRGKGKAFHVSPF